MKAHRAEVKEIAKKNSAVLFNSFIQKNQHYNSPMSRLMMNYFSCFLIFFCISEFAFAQETEQRGWEVGVDMLSLIGRSKRIDNINNTYGLIFRKSIKTNFKNGAAVRFRPEFGFDSMLDPIVPGTNQPRSYTVSFDLGYERQNRVKRFVHYYGSDVMLRFARSNSVIGSGITDPANPTELIFTRNISIVTATGLTAFTGGKFFFAERLSLSLETTALLTLSFINSKQQGIDSMGNQKTPSVTTFDTDGVGFTIEPVSVIYLSYYF